MYIVDPDVAAKSIGLSVSASPGNLTLDMLRSIVDRLKCPIEAALDVKTVDRCTSVDTFLIQRPRYQNQRVESLSFRLSNGFVSADSVTILHDGVALIDPSMMVDLEMGVVILPARSSHYYGRYDIAYVSGFTADPTTGIIQGAPAFFADVASVSLTAWCRAVLIMPRTLKDVRYGELDAAIRREVPRRVYSTYMRPRCGVQWPAIHSRLP